MASVNPGTGWGKSRPATITPATSGVPIIVVGTDEYRVNDLAAAVLAGDKDLYQRGGFLVQVVEAEPGGNTDGGVWRQPGSPVIRLLPPALPRDRLTRSARWVKRVPGQESGTEERPTHPPAWSVNAVQARGEWPGVRHLEAVVNYPVFLSDGSVLASNGYDPATGLLVAMPPGLRVVVPENPTAADVHAAVATIDDILFDFPFERPEHRAAWYAGLLTPLAWFGFQGPAPLTLIDGNVRGIGKGLLADLIALILTGRRFPLMGYTPDKEELRKRITSLAMEGERLILLDNLAGSVGNDALDMALTADRWKDRVLGGNAVFDGPLNLDWYATGNNVQLRADTARRSCHCRLETQVERPELRAGLKHPDRRRYVLENRGSLLSAALTILRGWHVAGRPRHELTPWGTFEVWSGVVREAVVWAGLSDPGETREALQSAADRDAMAMTALMNVLAIADPNGRGMTTAEIIDTARKPGDPAPAWAADLRAAVEELCGKLDGQALGYKFRHFIRRKFGGRMIDKAWGGHGNVARWAVFVVGRATPLAPSLVSPALSTGGDGGDGGHVPSPPDIAGKKVRPALGHMDTR